MRVAVGETREKVAPTRANQKAAVVEILARRFASPEPETLSASGFRLEAAHQLHTNCPVRPDGKDCYWRGLRAVPHFTPSPHCRLLLLGGTA